MKKSLLAPATLHMNLKIEKAISAPNFHTPIALEIT
jgi:hypothetical protein